ncbi:MAG: 2-phosphosulfolactate phosphatase, partial [Acidimicrobiales bacterium]
LAVGRRDVSSERPWSLSPAALAIAPFTPRLVLPSPNGSAIAAVARGVVVAACLRNASAAARWILDSGFGTVEDPAVVIAAGERWPDASLRPALEDQLGAGALLWWLRGAGCALSPEATAAASTYEAVADVAQAVRDCASGLELSASGYMADLDMAVALDADEHGPVLENGGFVAR